MLAEKGFEGAQLGLFATEGIPDVAFGEMVEYYAMHAGRYCTDEAKKLMSFFKSVGCRQSLLGIAKFEPEPIEKPEHPKPRSLTDVNLLENTVRVNEILGRLAINAGSDPAFVRQWELTSVAQSHPELREKVNVLNASAPIHLDDGLLTVTRVGEMLNPVQSARAVNKMLTRQGYQSELMKGEPPYVATLKGKPFSRLDLKSHVNENGKSHNSQQLRWRPSIVPELQSILDAQSNKIGGAE
jgi:hypothetical protein